MDNTNVKMNINSLNINSTSSGTLSNTQTSINEGIGTSEISASSQTQVDIVEKSKQDPSYIPSIGEKTIISAIENANKKLVSTNKELRISVHEETKKINIKIVDKESHEVIKEYPPEKLLDIFAKMVELSGLIVDEKR